MYIVRQATTDPAEQELTQAVRRVHKRFGKDLDAFFRYVQEQARQKSLQQDLPFESAINSSLKNRNDTPTA